MDRNRNGKVCIANVNPGSVRMEFMVAVLSTIVEDVKTGNGRIGHFVPRLAGPLISVYRNYAVQHFMDYTDDEYLCFVDSDVILPPGGLITLADQCDDDTPIISGLYYCVLNEGVRPSAWMREEAEVEGVKGVHLVALEEAPETVTQVDAVGAGCLMLHRPFLDKMRAEFGAPEPWFAQSVHDNVLYGEDFTFCMRAKQMDVPVLIDPSVVCGHIKHYNLDTGFREQLDLTPSVPQKVI